MLFSWAALPAIGHGGIVAVIALLSITEGDSQSCADRQSFDNVSLFQQSIGVVNRFGSSQGEARRHSFLDYQDSALEVSSEEQASMDKIESFLGAPTEDLRDGVEEMPSSFIEAAKASTGKVVPGGNTAQPVSLKNIKIPRQLILTGKPDRFEDMDSDLRSNVLDSITLSNDVADWQSFNMESDGNVTLNVHPRWFGDTQCRDYIKEHYDEELLDMFEHAHPGYYKGDICRAAILYQEGGFYTDVDVQLAVPLIQLVDENTTFMSSYSVNGDIFNGLIAAVPKSEVLGETLQEIRRWYRGEAEQDGLMGTMTMLRGIENVVGNSCPTKDLKAMQSTSQWNCGPHTIRLYQEGDLICFMAPGVEQPAECPQSRKDSSLFMRYGLFVPGQQPNVGRSFIGWPKASKCTSTDCGRGHGL